MEYILLHSANSVSQAAANPVRGIGEALSNALHTVMPSTWQVAPPTNDATLYVVIGAAALVVGYFALRR